MTHPCKIVHIFPEDDPTLHFQQELSSIDDFKWHKSFDPPKFSCVDRIIQIILFIFTLGPLRLVIALISTILFFIFTLIIAIFGESVSNNKCLLGYGIFIARVYFRLLIYCCGIIWINKKGNPSSRTRCFVYNHTSILDGILVYYCRPFSVVCMESMKNVFYFGRIFKSIDSIFINRGHRSGNSQLIRARMEDYSKLPIAIAPEGKISNGSILFRFHTGAFLSQATIQPITIRYKHLVGCAGITLDWTLDGFFEWVWLASCVPLGIIDMTFLEPFTPEDFAGMSPEKKAEVCELSMANNLGVLATNRSSYEIFRGDGQSSQNARRESIETPLNPSEFPEPYVEDRNSSDLSIQLPSD